MRETDRKVDDPRQTPTPGTIMPRPAEHPAGAPRVDPAAKLRLSTPQPPASHQPAPAAATPTAHKSSNQPQSDAFSDETGPNSTEKGLVLPWPVLLGGAGVLVAIVAVIAMLAFNAGAHREREQLLPRDGEAPEIASLTNGRGDPIDPLTVERPPAAPETGRNSGNSAQTRSNTANLPVFGVDPREQGKNYLVVERLMFDDAMAVAQFLTDNSLPSVMVAPEGTEDIGALQRNPQGVWLVIVREGFTRDEFRASAGRAEEIKNTVIKLGRRWKQDHKGSTNLANSYWNKFGK